MYTIPKIILNSLHIHFKSCFISSCLLRFSTYCKKLPRTAANLELKIIKIRDCLLHYSKIHKGTLPSMRLSENAFALCSCFLFWCCCFCCCCCCCCFRFWCCCCLCGCNGVMSSRWTLCS